MPIFPCSAILFDLDGVLVDSTTAIVRHWRAWAEAQGLEAAKVLAVVHGRRTVEVLQLMAPHLDAPAEAKVIEERVSRDEDGISAAPGALELLESLPPERWCVVTSGTRALARVRLELARLPVPPVLVGADDVERGKPHPEPYWKGAQLLGVEARRCLVVEDAPAGLEAAHAAGMKAIAITSTFPASDLTRADAIVNGLVEIRVRNLSGLSLEVAVTRAAS